MVMSGSNLETCEHVGGGLSNVVVGRIEKIEKHPDADKLVVCQLNVGKDEPVQIVTGATNVYEGAIGSASQQQNSGTSARTAKDRGRSQDYQGQAQRR